MSADPRAMTVTFLEDGQLRSSRGVWSSVDTVGRNTFGCTECRCAETFELTGAFASATACGPCITAGGTCPCCPWAHVPPPAVTTAVPTSPVRHLLPGPVVRMHGRWPWGHEHFEGPGCTPHGCSPVVKPVLEQAGDPAPVADVEYT